MAYKVGEKGQVVISKRLRAQLGITPGWIAIQRLVGDRVEMRFIPPEHTRSLKGRLASYVESPLSSEELRKAREEAWHSAVMDSRSE